MSLETAFEKVQAFLLDQETRAGIVARQLGAKEKPGDAKLAELLVAEIRARTRFDGSIDGSLVRTAWAAWEMMDLGSDPLHGGLDRPVSWVLERMETGDAVPDPAPLTLPSGAVMTDPEHATFAARCLALRVLLRARRDNRPRVAQLVDELASGPQPPTLDLSACVLAALALVPPPHRRHLDGLVARLGTAQLADGSWGDRAELFLMLEALILAGIRPARSVIAKAAPALTKRQRATGAFDEPPNEERALIGLRALQVALED